MTTIKSTLLCLACFSLSSCAGDLTAGERIAVSGGFLLDSESRMRHDGGS